MNKVILLLCVLLANPLHAQEKLVVLSESWPPFIYEKDSEVVGLVTEKVKEVLEIAQLDYQIKLLPWARSYGIARSTPNTFIYSIFRSAEREALFHWYCPLMDAEDGYLYRLASNTYSLKSLDDARQYRIGVMREDLTHQYLRDKGFIERVNLDISADEDINLMKLISGRVDFIVQSPSAIRFRLKTLGLSTGVVVAELVLLPEKKQQHCLALNIDSDPDLVRQLNTAFHLWQQQHITSN